MANETAFAFLDDIELPLTKPGSIPGKRVSGLACYVVSPGGLKTVVQAVEQAKKAAGLCVSDPVKHSMDKQIESIYRSSHIGKRAETHFDLAKASVRDVAVEALKALVDADAKIIAGVLWPWASTPAKKPQPALLRWAIRGHHAARRVARARPEAGLPVT